MKLDNKTYDLLKWLVLIFMPAFITFVGVIGPSWGWGTGGRGWRSTSDQALPR